MPVKVAIQGQAASFHDIAARQFFGDDLELVACETFREAFAAVKAEQAERAVIAIENSLYGSLNEVYDLLLKHKFWISGETYLQIHQCLIGLPGTKLADIQEVYSMPVALAQCEAFLDNKLAHAKRVEYHDTTASVQAVRDWQAPHKAAIAGVAAAQAYQLEVLQAKIETNHHNYTRFLLLGQDRLEKAGDKTSLQLVTDHQPGALHRALGTFAQADINLTKLQSRPIIGEAWHYMFYIDVSAGLQEPNLQTALEQLAEQNCEVTVLGSYKHGEYTST